MSGCEVCDFIGPELPTLEADWRAAHRALHVVLQILANLVVTPLLPILEQLDSAMHSAYRAKTRRRRA